MRTADQSRLVECLSETLKRTRASNESFLVEFLCRFVLDGLSCGDLKKLKICAMSATSETNQAKFSAMEFPQKSPPEAGLGLRFNALCNAKFWTQKNRAAQAGRLTESPTIEVFSKLKR